MDELAGLYIKLVAKDEATGALERVDRAMQEAELTAEELQKALSAFGGNAKSMYLAAAGAADRYGASMADLQAAQLPLEVHVELAQKLADKWHNASRVASELQSKISTLGQQGSGASGYYAEEASRLGSRQGFLNEAHNAGLLDQPQYLKHMAAIQGEMNSLLERANDAERRYAEAISFKNQRSAEGARIAQEEMTAVERLNQQLIHLDQLRSTGDIGTDAYNRRKGSLEAQLYDITNPQNGQLGPGREQYAAHLASQQADADNLAEARRIQAMRHAIAEQSDGEYKATVQSRAAAEGVAATRRAEAQQEAEAQRVRDAAYRHWVASQADAAYRQGAAGMAPDQQEGPVYGPGREEHRVHSIQESERQAEAAASAEARRLKARQDYYRWLSTEGNAAEAGSVSEQRKSNMETMNTLALLERLKPAEEQHANRIRRYTQELQRGAITQDQFNKLQIHSVMQMNAQRAGGGKQTGQMAMQGSYMAQDIATVMSMGGSPHMAMMSGMNNLSQLVMVAGVANPVLLSLAAAAVTVGAAFVDWGKIIQNLSSILDGFTGRVREIPNAAAGVKNAMDFRANAVKQQFDANLAGQQKTPEQIAKEAEQLRTSIQRLEQLQLEAQDNIEKARGAATEQGRGKANQANLYRDTMGSIYGGVAGDLGKGFVESVMNAFATRAQAADYVNQSEGYLQAVKNLKEFTEQLDEASRKLRLTEAVVPMAENREDERSLEEFRKQGEAAEQKAREKVRQMEQDAWKPSSASPLADKAAKNMAEFAEAMGNAGYDADTQALFNSQYAASTTGMLDEEINKLSRLNESKISPQMMGFSQFGQSFQMSLLKPEDEAKKQRKEQIDIMKETRDAIKAKHGGTWGP